MSEVSVGPASPPSAPTLAASFMRSDEFFAYARARHQLYLNRRAGLPRAEWTKDPILQAHRFTNIFRELDKTTIWCRRNVREKYELGYLLPAIVAFRWFNRIETGEVICNQPNLFSRLTPMESFLTTGDTSQMATALRAAIPDGPWVTGSYMIRSPNGMPKLEGMLHLCSLFYDSSNWVQRTRWMIEGRGVITLREVTRWLETLPGMGPFLAYEVVTDLRHTPLLNEAPDILIWANVGPGALDGLGRLMGRRRANPRKPKHTYRVQVPEEQAVAEMAELLRLSRFEENWPQAWGVWEMRDIEHTLCEVSKYERVRLGEGTPRQRFNETRS